MNLPKKIVLIGHRGVGKTSLLTRIEKIYSEAGRASGRRVKSFDLDREIEQSAGRSISRIFQEDGEAVFRRLETMSFVRLEAEISKTTDDVVIAVGAGYPVLTLKKDWQVIWVRRASDETGRIFTDRPRLDPSLSPLDEFLSRHAMRSPLFAARADDVLFLDEGADVSVERSAVHPLDPAEHDYFLDRVSDIGGALTLRSENFARDFETWANRRSRWGLYWFELRDDLLTHEQMVRATQHLPRRNLLISFRDPTREAQTAKLIESTGAAFDWPSERGVCAYGKPEILSTHARLSDSTAAIEASLAELEKVGARLNESSHASSPSILKAALAVFNFRELRAGHEWQQKDPAKRVFLPMSPNGRWSWYRLLRANGLALNFFRESDGSALDQPTLLQWIRREALGSKSGSKFVAVLGDPVSHSRTPMEHAAFFREYERSVYAINMSESEWRDGALEWLLQLGLTHAAVTAPLKRLAFERADNLDETSKALRAVNTLVVAPYLKIDGTSAPFVQGANTDLVGLQHAADMFAKEFASCKSIIIWGGGGTLDVVKRVFPSARAYSVRTGQARDLDSAVDSGALTTQPDLIIWASGLGEQSPPPPSWKPTYVFDLNYSEASLGRSYALKVNAKYISGLAMFRAQANAQRDFWGDFRREYETNLAPGGQNLGQEKQ